MTIGRAVNRLVWRFEQGKPFQPNLEDGEALNTIVEFVGEAKGEHLHTNRLFAKCYISLYKIMLEHYGATIFDKTPQQQLHKFLDTPLEEHFRRFTDYLNTCELYKAIEKPDPKLEDVCKAQGYFDQEEVAENLTVMITECLRKYS